MNPFFSNCAREPIEGSNASSLSGHLVEWSSFYVNIMPNKVRLLAQEAPSNKQSSKVRGAVDNWRPCCRALSRLHGTRVAFVILTGVTVLI